LGLDRRGGREIRLTSEGSLSLTQWDVRELQKAKAAIRAATNILMGELGLIPEDIERLVLTGSFGGQVDIDAVIHLGMIPPIRRDVVETIANGAGFGAAMFLSDEGFDLGLALADRAVQIDLDLNPSFNQQYIQSMTLTPNGKD
jgi:uncharacterized 2Fe-2S/4Fe-4S cluster protein (DUF4445 family)